MTFIWFACIILTVILTLISRIIDKDTDRMIDEFCRKQHGRDRDEKEKTSNG